AVRGQRGLGKAVAANHVLIVNFPGAARVRQIVEELRSDPHHRKQEIVIISDQVAELPFAYEEVIFIHGSPLDESTYDRAQARDAELALVLATSYSDPASDAVVASAVSVLDGVKSELYIVAECLHEEHRTLFESVRCDAIVPILRIGSNLLVQEAHDPGVTQSIDEITSNLRGDTLFSTEVQGEVDGDYLELIGPLLERDINVLCVARGRQSITRFRGIRPAAGDRLVYIAKERQSWEQLRRS
ncbi:MAG: NAD-binding protein, partial [Planctomycetota bacterium]